MGMQAYPSHTESLRWLHLEVLTQEQTDCCCVAVGFDHMFSQTLDRLNIKKIQ